MESRMETLIEKGKVKELIEKAKNIYLFHHVKPDGDCLGSSQGLYNILKDNYKDKNIYWVGDNNQLFEQMEYSPVTKDIDNTEDSLAIILDVSGSNRVEFIEKAMKCTMGIIRIDHHPNVSDYNPIACWLDTNTPATCQIVAEMAQEYNWTISPLAATWLYLGLVTDSDRFLFRSVTEKTYNAASMLTSCGANRDKVHAIIYKRTRKDIEFEAEVLSNFKTTDDGNVVYYYVSKELQNRLGFRPDDCARSNIIANIDGIKAWVLFIQYDDHIRVEFRCIPGYKINTVAFKFNGGGHDQASGCKLKSIDEMQGVIEEVQRLVC